MKILKSLLFCFVFPIVVFFIAYIPALIMGKADFLKARLIIETVLPFIFIIGFFNAILLYIADSFKKIKYKRFVSFLPILVIIVCVLIFRLDLNSILFVLPLIITNLIWNLTIKTNSMTEINAQLEKIESLLPKIDKKNLQVSKACIGWHLEHSLLILNSSLKGLTMTNPSDYKPKFSLKKFIFLNFGMIPRGKIRAPKQFIPLETPTKESIEKLLNLAKERLEAVNGLPEKAYIRHPFLGDFDKKTTLRFLNLHTNHHLKIIDDILNKK